LGKHATADLLEFRMVLEVVPHLRGDSCHRSGNAFEPSIERTASVKRAGSLPTA